jgi:hypothetical protein
MINSQFFQKYWQNAQKLPVYCLTGELSGTSFSDLRKLYENWLPLGFSSLLSVAKGRSNEWFATELPTIFDWMNRKTRVRGTQALKLDNTRFDPWQSMRDTDRRFYWVEFGELMPTAIMNPDRLTVLPQPASIRADIRGNEVVLNDIGRVRKVTIWMERDMFDWEREIKVTCATAKGAGWKPRKLKPDPVVLFENLYQTGDRKLLFFGKIEIDIFTGEK